MSEQEVKRRDKPLLSKALPLVLAVGSSGFRAWVVSYNIKFESIQFTHLCCDLLML